MKKDHNILVLATDAFGAYGGIAQYTRDFVTALSNDKYVDDIIIIPRGKLGKLGNISSKIYQSYSVQSRVLYSILTSITVLICRPSTVICGHLYHGYLAFLASKWVNAKLVSILYGDEIWDGICKRNLLPLKRSDIVICCSEDTRDRAIAAGVSPERAMVLFCAVQDEFVPGDREAARHLFAIDEEDTVVLTVARLDGRANAVGFKGHDAVIPLIAALKRDGVRIRYLIAGIGEDQARLEGLVAREDVGDVVTFLGKVPYERLPDLYRAADLFAMPSRGEGFGIVFIEAMACGTPAIGLAIGGAPDALGHGELGRCVSENEFCDAFFEEISFCNERDPTLSSRVRDRFNFKKFQECVQDIVKRVR